MVCVANIRDLAVPHFHLQLIFIESQGWCERTFQVKIFLDICTIFFLKNKKIALKNPCYKHCLRFEKVRPKIMY